MRSPICAIIEHTFIQLPIHLTIFTADVRAGERIFRFFMLAVRAIAHKLLIEEKLLRFGVYVVGIVHDVHSMPLLKGKTTHCHWTVLLVSFT